MMSGSNWGHDMMGGYGLVGAILWVVILVVRVRFGLWFYKQIQKG